MNTLRNSVKLIGRLGQDPEVKLLDTGNKVATFSLATSESYTKKDGSKQEQTQWHSIVVWGKLAVVCEKYLKKGKEIAIDGQLTYSKWDDNNGVRHYKSQVIASDLLFIGSNSEIRK